MLRALGFEGGSIPTSRQFQDLLFVCSVFFATVVSALLCATTILYTDICKQFVLRLEMLG